MNDDNTHEEERREVDEALDGQPDRHIEHTQVYGRATTGDTYHEVMSYLQESLAYGMALVTLCTTLNEGIEKQVAMIGASCEPGQDSEAMHQIGRDAQNALFAAGDTLAHTGNSEASEATLVELVGRYGEPEVLRFQSVTQDVFDRAEQFDTLRETARFAAKMLTGKMGCND